MLFLLSHSTQKEMIFERVDIGSATKIMQRFGIKAKIVLRACDGERIHANCYQLRASKADGEVWDQERA